jgi:hypothetical protein
MLQSLRPSVCLGTRSLLSVKLYFTLPLFLLLLLSARPAAADTLYTYIGGNFTFIDQPAQEDLFTTSNHVLLTFTVPGSPLICLTFCSITAEDLSIGIQGLLDGSQPFGMIQTDSSGNILAWDFGGCLLDFPDCEDRHVSTSNVFGDSAILGNALAAGPAGAWTITTITTVPEPSTLATAICGMLLLVGVVWRRRTLNNPIDQPQL